jgi:hypothetical protein
VCIRARTLFVYFKQREKIERWRLCGNCLQIGSNQEGSQEDCRMKLVTLLVQSDNNRFSRKANKDNTMVTKDHRHARRKSKAEKLAEMDKELTELKAYIEKLELWMW